MNLSTKQQDLYDKFYESTHETDALDTKTECLVGLAAAMASNCEPCTTFYLKRCQSNRVSKQEIQAVLAKVMAVAAGQKRLQSKRSLDKANITLDDFA